MSKLMRISVVALVLMSLIAGVGLASGSYTGKPPRPGNIDHPSYHLGKQIFSGKLKLSDSVSADQTAQQAFLERLEQRLPEKERTKAQLRRFAGKLNDEQLQALEYYLSVRYRFDRSN